MPSRFTVSIITATLNAASNIHKLQRSIEKQENIDIQWVVVDGGSQDNTLATITSSSFSTTTETLKGSSIYEALNRGVELSKGEWLIFMGADDQFYESNSLSNCLTLNSNCQIALARVKNINRSSAKIPEYYNQKWDDSMIWRNTIHHQGIFYHRSCFSQFKFDTTFKVLADYHFNLRLFLSGARACQSEQVLTISEASGISKDFNRSLYKEELQVKKDLLNGWKLWFNYPWIMLKMLYKSI